MELASLLKDAQEHIRFASTEECEVLLVRVTEYISKTRACKKRLVSETAAESLLDQTNQADTENEKQQPQHRTWTIPNKTDGMLQDNYKTELG